MQVTGDSKEPDTSPETGPDLLAAVRTVGIVTWSFIGVVATLAVLAALLSTISEVVLPLLLAAVLAVVLRPAVVRLSNRGLSAGVAALVTVGLLVGVMTTTVVITLSAVADQSSELGGLIGSAFDDLGQEADDLGLDPGVVEEPREAAEESRSLFLDGVVRALAGGLRSAAVLAAGIVLGVLIMYYLLKDGPVLRGWLVARVPSGWRDEVDGLMTDSVWILRAYARARTVLAFAVASFISVVSLVLGIPLVASIFVVNLVGGYIPYIGAFVGGGLAVLLAVSEGGVGLGLVMLAVVAGANLALENLLEPRVMSRHLDLHPLAVLLVTAAGGIVAGVTGLILAVPFTVITAQAIGRFGPRRDLWVPVADRVPALRGRLGSVEASASDATSVAAD